MKKIIIITILILAVILSILDVIFIKRNHESVSINKLRIAYFKEMGFTPVFVAKEKGFFKDVGLDVDLVEVDSKQLLDVLITNRVDVTAAALPSVAGMEIEKPGLIKIFGLGGETLTGEFTSGLVVLKNSPIEKIEDLKGKIVATDAAKNIPAMNLIFKKIGLDPGKDIKIIEVGGGIIAQALVNKQVDAIYCSEPTLTILTNKFDMHAIETNLRAKYIVDPYLTTALSVVTAAFAQKNPEIVKKLFDVYDRSVKFIADNQNESKLIASKYTPLTEDIITKVGLPAFLSPKEKVDFDKINYVIDTFVTAGILKQKIDIKPMFITQ
ncbi:MAG: ABC transporter substrate-binding protein [Patescibacteria group bacterium]|nr:ABC transporter substrate-binding protein [Patescibacteria group bacterium]